MAASVRIEDEAFSDIRIEMLGSLAGYSRYEALGRMACLWRFCTQRQMHVVSEAAVNACLGPGGVDNLISVDLGERVEGGIRVRGTHGRIEWLEELRASRRAGGRARAATAKRDSKGKLTHNCPASSLAGVQQAPSSHPAESSAPAPAPAPAPVRSEEETSASPTAVSGLGEVKAKVVAAMTPVHEFAHAAIGEINRLTRLRFRASSKSVLEDCRKLVRDGYTPEQAKLVVTFKHREWCRNEKMAGQIRPSTLLRPSNFVRYLDEAEARRRAPQKPCRVDDSPPTPTFMLDDEKESA